MKFISAQQARKVYQHQNTKKKLLRTNASIWFNKICRHENLQPKYIDIKISGNNKRSHTTKQAAVKHRINLELKHLYKKKALLNKQLYETHLECANYWQESWYLIQRLEYQNSQHMNDVLYDKLNKKLDTLRHTQTQHSTKNRNYTSNTPTNTKFYPRIKNMSNIQFNKEEESLLQLGLNYALEKPTQQITQELVIDTENAIRQLNENEHNIYRFLAHNKIKQIQNTTSTIT